MFIYGRRTETQKTMDKLRVYREAMFIKINDYKVEKP